MPHIKVADTWCKPVENRSWKFSNINSRLEVQDLYNPDCMRPYPDEIAGGTRKMGGKHRKNISANESPNIEYADRRIQNLSIMY